eukprot:213-Pyramimonas_sp.AAC.1
MPGGTGPIRVLVAADLQWAFDASPHLAMRINAHSAGVRGTDWLLLDGFSASDRQFVAWQRPCVIAL